MIAMTCLLGRSRRKDRTRLARTPGCELLESRTVAASSAGLAPLGQIAGQIINESSGVGINHVQVQLINSQGRIAQRTFTNAQGLYAFPIRNAGAYTIHEVSPRGFTQVSPTFANTPPTGTYVAGAGNASWNYSSPNTNPVNGQVGPNGWANIAPAGFEPFESPIKLTGPTVNLDRVVQVNYNTPAVPSQAVNTSHQIQVQYAANSGNFVLAGGIRYDLAEFHYHAPAETTVNGKAYTMEEHFVNMSASGGVTVISVFLKLGARHNSALDPVFNAASVALGSPNTSTIIPTPVNLQGLLPTNHQGWFYQGSLTTPPLSQPLNWFVYATPITLDRLQLNQYVQVATSSGFYPNARPVQPIDGRTLNRVDAHISFTNQTFVAANFGLVG
jgi:carbonic anhydrase